MGGIFYGDLMVQPTSSTTARLTQALLACGFIWLNMIVAQAGLLNYADQHRAAASFAWEVLSSRPRLLLVLAEPALVIAAIYALFFWMLAILARPRSAAEARPARRLRILVLTWASSVWLLSYLHLLAFPRSNWSWWIEPLQSPSASIGANFLAAAWICSRGFFVIKSWFLGIKDHLAASKGAKRRLLILALLAIPLSGWTLHDLPSQGHENSSKKPNILIVGLDSLRRDIALGQRAAHTPNLDAFRAHAYIEANVVSPLARTFPAWVTILTGLPPARSGARGNLVGQDQLPRAESLGWKLKSLGYRTIYATDETRFSNIGTEFGFDEVISPQFGARDFLIGHFSDQLLVNFAVQLPYAEYLLPSLVGNRAFAQAYRPNRFVDRLSEQLGPADSRPTAMAVHMCMAHWPYYSAQTPTVDAHDDFAPYLQSVSELDAQFGYLQSELRRLGYLNDNTLIVLLADHGEALTLAESAPRTITAPSPLHDAVPEAGVGHGTSLLSPSQWQVFLMFGGHSAVGSIPRGYSNALASLADLPGAILELVGEAPRIDSERPLSVVDATTGDKAPPDQGREYVALETGFRPPGLDVMHPDGSAALKIARSSFDVLDDGRVEVKSSVYEISVQTKDFGVTDGNRTLALVRTADEPVLVEFDTDGAWRIFPRDRGQDSSEPALLAAACKDPEMSHRIPNWCTDSRISKHQSDASKALKPS